MNSPNLLSANLGLLVATTVALLAGGAIVFGPSHGAVVNARSRFAEQALRFEAWRSELVDFRRPSDLERSQIDGLWDELLAHVRPADDAAALVARVTEDFHSSGVRNLRVHPVAQEPGVELETHVLHSPIDGQTLSVLAVPVSVEFRASSESTLRVLERLDSGDLPARLEILELRRDLPVVDVRMELEYFVRRASAP